MSKNAISFTVRYGKNDLNVMGLPEQHLLIALKVASEKFGVSGHVFSYNGKYLDFMSPMKSCKNMIIDLVPVRPIVLKSNNATQITKNIMNSLFVVYEGKELTITDYIKVSCNKDKII